MVYDQYTLPTSQNFSKSLGRIGDAFCLRDSIRNFDTRHFSLSAHMNEYKGRLEAYLQRLTDWQTSKNQLRDLRPLN